ncbi:proton-coupled folate transporter-like [Achroia grisella]|uniref:proton-coupled folate transporter-like n=1 Tax=Achroia grisella TaxID=688607 RepID=UPI0027D245D6|nr:proton-coupled folate transporter-like [Achroia grisella]
MDKPKDQTNGEVELQTVKDSDVRVNGLNKKQKEKLSFVAIFNNFRNFFTVEPYLLCYVLPLSIQYLGVQKFNTEKACRTDLNYSQTICDIIQTGEGNDNMTELALSRTSQIAADILTWKEPLQKFIPAVLMLNIGAWSDRTGNRKTLMLVPIFGEMLSTAGLMVATYYFTQWPLWVTGLIDVITSSCTGGFSVALAGCFSYVADVTTQDTRTFRMGVMAVIVTLGIPVGSSVGGILTEELGYYGVFGLVLAMYAFGFFYTLFKIHDVKPIKQEGTLGKKIINFIHPRNLWATLSLIVLSRGKLLLRILLVIWAHILIMGPVVGEGAVFYYYTLIRYKMEVVEFSLFTTYTVLIGTAGTAIAVLLFSKTLKFHDSILGLIATTCKVLGSIVYAFAPNKTWLYAAPVFDIFGNSGVTAIRSLGTKVVDQDSIGKMCSLIGFIDAIVPVVAIPIYTQLWSNTLATFPGAIYLLGAILTVPDFFVFATLFVMHKKEDQNVVANAEVKEKYAYENDITAL